MWATPSSSRVRLGDDGHCHAADALDGTIVGHTVIQACEKVALYPAGDPGSGADRQRRLRDADTHTMQAGRLSVRS
jgi:hypothetical protein